MGNTRAATAAADPPLEPPGVRAGSQGLRVMPNIVDSVASIQPFSGLVLLANGTMPAAFRRCRVRESNGPFTSFM